MRTTSISFLVTLSLAISLPIQLEAYFSWSSLKDAANYAKDTVSYYAGYGADAGNGTTGAEATDAGNEKPAEPVAAPANEGNPGKPADKPPSVKIEGKASQEGTSKKSEAIHTVKPEQTKLKSKTVDEEDSKESPAVKPPDKVEPKDKPDEPESVEQRPIEVPPSPEATKVRKTKSDPGTKSKTGKDAEEVPKPKATPADKKAPVNPENDPSGLKKSDSVPKETPEPEKPAKETSDSKKTNKSDYAKKTDSDKSTEPSEPKKEKSNPAKARNAATFALYRLTGYITKPAKKIKELVVGKEKKPDNDSAGSTVDKGKSFESSKEEVNKQKMPAEWPKNPDNVNDESNRSKKTDDESTTSMFWKTGASLLNAGKSAIFGTNDAVTGESGIRSVKEKVKAKGFQANDQALVADIKPEILASIKRYMQDHNSFETAESKDGISKVSFKGLNITDRTDLTLMGDQFTFLLTGVTGDVTGKYEKKLLRFFKQAGDFTISLKGASFCITGKAVPDAKPSPEESSEMTKEGPQYSLQKPDAGAQCVLTSFIEAKDIKKIDSGVTGKLIKFVEKITKRFTEKVFKPIKKRVEDVLCEGVVAKLKEAFHSIGHDTIEQIVSKKLHE